jgi:prepilin-type processing-associated H-X9-DG protein
VDEGSYQFPKTDHTGVIFLRSRLRSVRVVDGLSKTYLAAEKHLGSEDYTSGLGAGDNENMYVGFDHDNGRVASVVPKKDGRISDHVAFGSAHASGWNALFCDGSVALVHYDIDWRIHKRMANRQNGN